MIQSVIDPCLFYKHTPGINGAPAKWEFCCTVVDDFIYACNGDTDSFLSLLRKRFDMKDLGEPEHCLGLRITRDRAQRYIYLDQS